MFDIYGGKIAQQIFLGSILFLEKNPDVCVCVCVYLKNANMSCCVFGSWYEHNFHILNIVVDICQQ